MAINCCHGCVPPKRTPTCKFDGTCNKYSEAKEKHDAMRDAERKQKEISYGITAQRNASVCKANRRGRNKYGLARRMTNG